VLLDSGDLVWPGEQPLVRYSGGVLSFRFGKRVECVLQFLFKRRAGHMRKGITREGVNACMGHPAGLTASALDLVSCIWATQPLLYFRA
jgi:hypothetical protein